MVGMAEKPKQTRRAADPAPKPAARRKGRGPVLFISLDDSTETALVSFIAAQVVEPDRSAVGLKALRKFLGEQGYWPPKPAKS